MTSVLCGQIDQAASQLTDAATLEKGRAYQGP